MSALATPVRRTHVRVDGTVQGVGFRPHVYRLARAHALSGYVRNNARGVELEVQGPAPAVAAFLTALRADAPPLAVLESVRCVDCAPQSEPGFQIRASERDGVTDASVTPDSATCAECLSELFDPADRRHRYPFINCTNCGPRFTIVRGVPYDRPLTSMAGFVMCEMCRAEYEDPADRRFHAQPNACPACGPRVALHPGGDGDDDPVRIAAAALAAGEILAVKGIGGYHLACRADDEASVARLRSRKHREDKPFALMTATLAGAAELVALGAGERALLVSPARPIVLAARRGDAPVAASVAPGAVELGVMLPYSPLHHLLLADLAQLGIGALVLTSGNLSDEPIAFADDDARRRLGTIADRILSHDRPIETRTDDSVLRVIGTGAHARPLMLRRSRGYVPAALTLPGGAPQPLLACGAELKHTFCLARGEHAWVSHHIGDLANYETLESFHDGVGHFERLFAVTPQVVAHDMHPDYLSTAYARERTDVELIAVQHHHAHFAACLAEHGWTPGGRPAIGAIFDGTGYGSDGTVWGGELLCGDSVAVRRIGRLLPVRLPGGEQAIRQPWRMACAWLHETTGPQPARPAALRDTVRDREWTAVSELVARGFRAPVTTSMGRLFDAAAALCGIRPTVSYEGQAAIEFEAAAGGAGSRISGAYPVRLAADNDGLVLDPRDAIGALGSELGAGVAVGVVAARFHAGVAAGTVRACARACEEQGADTVVLAGGVFQNRILLSAVRDGLCSRGLRVLVPERLPIGDGAIAYGQAAVAAAQLRSAT
jgi:hydrogenase maturation protein HypF